MFSELVYKIVLLKKATFPQGIYLLTIKSEPFTIIFLKIILLHKQIVGQEERKLIVRQTYTYFSVPADLQHESQGLAT